MNEKQKVIVDKIMDMIPVMLQPIYREVAEYAISLGYNPSIKGSKKDYADFTNTKLKRTIMKINMSKDFLGISLKFYALKSYDGVFKKAIQDRLATWKRLGYDTKCFGCGKCQGHEGYIVNLDDGGKGFLCGFGVLPTSDFSSETIEQVKKAMAIQNDYFVKKATNL